MLWLVVGTLSGALLLTPPPENSPVRTPGTLPRPSRSEVDLLLRAPDRRVRSTNPRLIKMLELGARQSATFAGLLAALDRTDVIVYVEGADAMPRTLDGRLVLLPPAHGHRYLRIDVRQTLPRNELVPLIAHELQHALEIAAVPDVRDQAAMAALYARIGERTVGGHAYDTAAARETGRRVRAELIG